MLFVQNASALKQKEQLSRFLAELTALQLRLRHKLSQNVSHRRNPGHTVSYSKPVSTILCLLLNGPSRELPVAVAACTDLLVQSPYCYLLPLSEHIILYNKWKIFSLLGSSG